MRTPYQVSAILVGPMMSMATLFILASGHKEQALTMFLIQIVVLLSWCVMLLARIAYPEQAEVN